MKVGLALSRIPCLIALMLSVAAPSWAQGDVGHQDSYLSREMIISLPPGKSVSEYHARYGTRTLETLPGTNTYRVGLPSGGTARQKSQSAMAADKSLRWAKPNFLYQAPEVRQGSMAFIDQGSMAFIDGQSPPNFYDQTQVDRIRIKSAQALSRGKGVMVAVIDTGVDFSHPLFANRIAAPYYDFIDRDLNPTDELGGEGSGHGTFVAGLIALAAPEARVMPLRAFGSDGRGTSFNIASAIRYAADNGAQIINMSFGLLDEDEMIRDAMIYARSRNVFMVASAGNSNQEQVNFPARNDLVLAVTSTNGNDDQKSSFANYGRCVDVAAPGTAIYSAYPGNRWAWWDGTSFSTALVSGEAALLLAPNRNLNRNVLQSKITSYGVSIDSLNQDYAGKLGSVRVDFRAAVEALNYYEPMIVYDKKYNKGYFVDSPDGTGPLVDLKTSDEEFKVLVEPGPDSWWQIDYTDPDANASSPMNTFVNIDYRPEAGFEGSLQVEFYQGVILLSSTTLSVDGGADPITGRGKSVQFRWDLSGVVRNRLALAAARVRIINLSTNRKPIWLTFSNLESK